MLKGAARVGKATQGTPISKLVASLSSGESKAFLTSTAYMLLLGGLSGFWLSEDIDAVWKLLAKGKGLKEHAREFVLHTLGDYEYSGGALTDIAMNGLPAAVGIDASASLGLGSVFGLNQAANPDEAVGGIAGGAPFGMAQQLASWGWDTVKNPTFDSFYMGARANAPTLVKHAIRLNDMFSDDAVRDTRGGMLLDKSEIGAKEKLAIAGGFTPLAASSKYADRALTNRLTLKAQADRKAKAVLVAEALLKGDNAYASKLFNEINNAPENNGYVSPQEVLTMVSNAYLQRSKSLPSTTPSAGNLQGRIESAKVYPSVAGQRQSHAERTLLDLQLAEQLGQPSLAAGQARSLPSTLKQDLIRDSLEEGGLDPAVSGMILKKNIESQDRSQILLEQIGNPSGRVR
jgi:hypothetical protein